MDPFTNDNQIAKCEKKNVDEENENFDNKNDSTTINPDYINESKKVAIICNDVKEDDVVMSAIDKSSVLDDKETKNCNIEDDSTIINSNCIKEPEEVTTIFNHVEQDDIVKPITKKYCILECTEFKIRSLIDNPTLLKSNCFNELKKVTTYRNVVKQVNFTMCAIDKSNVLEDNETKNCNIEDDSTLNNSNCIKEPEKVAVVCNDVKQDNAVMPATDKFNILEDEEIQKCDMKDDSTTINSNCINNPEEKDIICSKVKQDDAILSAIDKSNFFEDEKIKNCNIENDSLTINSNCINESKKVAIVCNDVKNDDIVMSLTDKSSAFEDKETQECDLKDNSTTINSNCKNDPEKIAVVCSDVKQDPVVMSVTDKPSVLEDKETQKSDLKDNSTTINSNCKNDPEKIDIICSEVKKDDVVLSAIDKFNVLEDNETQKCDLKVVSTLNNSDCINDPEKIAVVCSDVKQDNAVMSAANKSNIFENKEIQKCDIKDKSTTIYSNCKNDPEKIAIVCNVYEQENIKTIKEYKFVSLKSSNYISTLNLYQSLITKVMVMKFEDEIDSGRFVLSNKTFKLIVSKLENQDDKNRFDEIENILYMAIKFLFMKNEEEFDRLEFMKSIEKDLISLLELSMNFSVRKALFSFLLLISSHSNVKGIFVTKNQNLANLIAYNTYMEHFVSSLDIAIQETITIEENFEFRIMAKILYDRFCFNFNYDILPSDDICFINQYLSYLKYGLNIFCDGVLKIFDACEKDKEKLEMDFVDTILAIENIIIHFVDILERKDFNDLMNNTIIYEILENIKLKLDTFNDSTKATLYNLGVLIFHTSTKCLSYGSDYLKFIHQLNVGNVMIKYFVDSEELKKSPILDGLTNFFMGNQIILNVLLYKMNDNEKMKNK
ncbi:Chitin binding domain-containing protein [Strongyloides ratti]|uniref:Chitin binding domain-containing protein n=1 Tax=Strongyloides ratti TaxID=34506 RepID=A0A090KZZ2_STRRB|nr:Chitin binding domain-containing protein [Strongyloides ratti]CEF61452.1 Chitin binding domain-containing protein [Strongyloides ratti]